MVVKWQVSFVALFAVLLAGSVRTQETPAVTNLHLFIERHPLTLYVASGPLWLAQQLVCIYPDLLKKLFCLCTT